MQQKDKATKCSIKIGIAVTHLTAFKAVTSRSLANDKDKSAGDTHYQSSRREWTRGCRRANPKKQTRRKEMKLPSPSLFLLAVTLQEQRRQPCCKERKKKPASPAEEKDEAGEENKNNGNRSRRRRRGCQSPNKTRPGLRRGVRAPGAPGGHTWRALADRSWTTPATQCGSECEPWTTSISQQAPYPLAYVLYRRSRRLTRGLKRGPLGRRDDKFRRYQGRQMIGEAVTSPSVSHLSVMVVVVVVGSHRRTDIGGIGIRYLEDPATKSRSQRNHVFAAANK